MGLPTYKDSSNIIRVQNIGVKKFRSLLRKKKYMKDCKMYMIKNVNAFKGASERSGDTDDDELESLKREFITVFQSELPAGLPPKGSIAHKIEVDPTEKLPHRGIFQLSPPNY